MRRPISLRLLLAGTVAAAGSVAGSLILPEAGPAIVPVPGESGSALAGASTRAATPPRVAVTVTDRRCAPGWSAPTAGRVTFRIADRARRGAAISLYNPYTGVTVARRTGLRPGTTTSVTVDLKPGNYTWSCVLSGGPAVRSADVKVRRPPVLGTAAGPVTVIPVSVARMAGPVAAYRAYVTQQLAVLSTEVGQLTTAIGSGQLAAAESAWLTAHLTWHRIGAAYGAFGTLGTAIDGLAPGQRVGQTQGSAPAPGFEGFHAVERDLWQQQDLAGAATDTAQLAQSVATLAAQFPTETITPADLLLRTHEILEDALRTELTGDDNYGSGTDMASVTADVDGTRELLGLLTPLLDQRAPDLVRRATTQLDRLDAALVATQQAGQWVPVTTVPLAQREQVDGAIGTALEILAVVPDVMPVEGSSL